MGCNSSLQQTTEGFKPNTINPVFAQKSPNLSYTSKGSEINNPIQNKNEQFPSKYNQINFRTLLCQLRQKYSKYTKNLSQNNKFNGVDDLKEEIRNILKALIKQKLLQTNQNKISIKQCKIQLSQQILKIMIQILKFIVKNSTLQNSTRFLQEIEAFLKTFSCFLKTKYPRSQNVEAGELSTLFKQFDATQQLDYDMLKNAYFSFTSNDEFEISKNIKLFINKIIDQLEKSYPKFQSLIKQINESFKIGRKISQNTAKYSILDSGTLNIKSTQITRVLIKWLESLQQFVDNPNKKINSSSYEYKFSKKSQINQVAFVKCDYNQLPQKMEKCLIPQILIQKENIKQNIGKSINHDFNNFNINLLKAFNKVNKYQSEVQSQQAELIKFSYFNNDFISWMVEEKLIKTIKILVQLGMKHEFKNSHLDLIKFKVNDLMRCQFVGNRKQIKQIFEMFKEKQIKGQLEIVKIKNRFNTFLGDAMIFFKIPSSFCICQCQLVLSQGIQSQDGKKMKNIETINHFLYELQRSPFGVLGQLSVFLRAKSQSVSNYCNKIKMGFEDKSQITNCKNNHKAVTREIQQNNKPFVCSQCLKYNNKYSNIIKVHECPQCQVAICNKCLNDQFKITDELIKIKFESIIKEYYKQKPQHLTSSEQQLQQKFKNQSFWQLFKQQEKINIYEAFKSQKVKAETLINHLQKQHVKRNPLQYRNSDDQKQKFILVTFKRGQIRLKCYQIDSQTGSIKNSHQQLQKYQKHQYIYFNQFDMILKQNNRSIYRFNQEYINSNNKTELLCQNIIDKGIYIFEDQSRSIMKHRFTQIPQNQRDNYVLITCPFVRQNEFSIEFIIDIDRSTKRNKQQGWMQTYFKQLPDLNQFRKNIKLPLQKINNQELEFIRQLNWKYSIKSMNLRGNQIQSIQILLENCVNIQKLYIGKNCLEEISFNIKLIHLKQINVTSNRIKKIVNLKNIPSIEEFCINNNELSEIWLENQQQASKQTNKQNADNDMRNQKNKNRQRKQPLKQVSKQSLKQVEKQPLQQNAQAQKVKTLYTFAYLKLFDLSYNRLKNVQFLQLMTCPALNELEITHNSILKLPKMNISNLRNADLRFNLITDISQFSQGQYFAKLTEMSLSKLKSTNFPILQNSLKILRYENSNLKDQFIEKMIQSCEFSNLIELSLSNNGLKKIPNLSKMISLKRLYLQENPIEEYNEQQESTKNLRKLDKLWISFKCQTQQFNEFRSKLTYKFVSPIQSLVCWRYSEQSNQGEEMKQLLPKREFLISQFKDQQFINQLYTKSHLSQYYHMKLNFKYFNLQQLTKYNWSSLQGLQLNSSALTDVAWKVIAQNAQFLPNLKFLELQGNTIRNIGFAELQSFKMVKLRGFKKISFLKNMLSNQSKIHLKNFKQSHRQVQVLY